MTINLRAKNRKRAKRDQLKYALNYRVIADGRDLTNQCFYYDGRRRIVGVNLLDDKGQSYLTEDKQDVARKFIKARRVRLVKLGRLTAANIQSTE